MRVREGEGGREVQGGGQTGEAGQGGAGGLEVDDRVREDKLDWGVDKKKGGR